MLIVDAGPLYAAAARNDRDHDRCVALLAEAEPPLVVPALVITEVSHLLATRLGAYAEAAFVRSVAQHELLIEPVLDDEWGRIAELTDTYADLPLGIVDASVIALAERYGATTIGCLDHRHFSVVRPRHVDALHLIP